MGEIADGLINGDFDSLTGEYIGEGDGYPRTIQGGKTKPFIGVGRKSEDLSWRKVTKFLNNLGIKQHLYPQVLKDYGCKYSGKKPLKNACFEVLKDFDKFKCFVKEWKPLN